jgi:hypothetical protein
MRHPVSTVQRSGLAMILGLVMASVLKAQSGGSFDLKWSTVDGGGIDYASAGEFVLGGSVGQPDAAQGLHGEATSRPADSGTQVESESGRLRQQPTKTVPPG